MPVFYLRSLVWASGCGFSMVTRFLFRHIRYSDAIMVSHRFALTAGVSPCCSRQTDRYQYKGDRNAPDCQTACQPWRLHSHPIVQQSVHHTAVSDAIAVHVPWQWNVNPDALTFWNCLHARNSYFLACFGYEKVGEGLLQITAPQ